MSVELSDRDLMKKMIEASEPREILKKALKRKTYGKNKRLLLSALNVNPSTCNVVYFLSHTPFKRKEMANDTFLFLDNEYKILGVLKGSTWDKSWEDCEDYNQEHSNYRYSFSIKKTRKALTERAFHILRFPAKDHLQKPIQVIMHTPKQQEYNRQQEKREELNRLEISKQERLQQYKVKKYEYLTFEEVNQMTSDLMVYVSQHIHRQDNIENIDEKLNDNLIKSSFSYYNTIRLVDVLSHIISIFKDMVRFHLIDEKQYNQKKIRIIELCKVFMGFNKTV